jgi:hypothetical protein
MRIPRAISVFIEAFALAAVVCPHVYAQGALLLQDADGMAEVLSPTGHDAVYFARICAASPTRLRRCAAGELGPVIGRYTGVAGYDWLTIPLIPYLYSVEDASQVPVHVSREMVQDLRLQYHDAQLTSLGANVKEGGSAHRGWNQLVGAAYERRIYAFRFETTEAQDDAFIAKMNGEANRSHFNLLFRNCADFSSAVLNFYFPHTFRRHILPDAGITSPRQVAFELERYASRHPEIHLTVMEIPLVPGFHHSSRVGNSAAGSIIVTGYVIPIAILNPYAAAVIIADGLVCGRYPLLLKNAQVLGPRTIASLAESTPGSPVQKAQNPRALVASSGPEDRTGVIR